MKKYQEYMDNIEVSEGLHRRLTGLSPAERKPAWRRYGALAAALLLAVGVGAFGLTRLMGSGADQPAAGTLPAQSGGPVIDSTGAQSGEDQPDIAVDQSGGADFTGTDQPEGTRTIGGYEIEGPGVVSYLCLPWIGYGDNAPPEAVGDMAPPAGGTRDMTMEDLLSAFGVGEDALAAHLDWGGWELKGYVGFFEDGTVWMLDVYGTSDRGMFELSCSPGRLPPTCVLTVSPEDTVTDVWGVPVTGRKGVGTYGNANGQQYDQSRQVELVANGTGCRYTVYCADGETAETLAARLVRWAVLEGLDLSGVSPEGATLPADSGGNVGDERPSYAVEP